MSKKRQDKLSVVKKIRLDNYELLLIEIDDSFKLSDPLVAVSDIDNSPFVLSDSLGKYVAKHTEFSTLKVSQDIFKINPTIWKSLIANSDKLLTNSELTSLTDILLPYEEDSETTLYGLVGRGISSEGVEDKYFIMYDTFTDLDSAREVFESMIDFTNLRITKYGKYKVVVGSRYTKVKVKDKSVDVVVAFMYYLESKYIKSYAVCNKSEVHKLFDNYLVGKYHRYFNDIISNTNITDVLIDTEITEMNSHLLSNYLSVREVAYYLKYLANSKVAPTANFLDSNKPAYKLLEEVYKKVDYYLEKNIDINSKSPVNSVVITSVTPKELLPICKKLVIDYLGSYEEELENNEGLSLEFEIVLSNLLSLLECYLHLANTLTYDIDYAKSLEDIKLESKRYDY